MEVHAHAHTARKKWTHYFWEFLMLFLAVFCGFLAEYQLEHKIERDREKQYMRSLLNDLKTDILNIDAVQQKNFGVKHIADSLFLVLTMPDYTRNTNSVYYLARTFSDRAFFYIREGTVKQLNNAGGLRLIRHKEIIDSLEGYQYAYSELLRLQELKELQLVNYREVMSRVFDIRVFETMVNGEVVRRPAGNPGLFSETKELLNNFLMKVHYVKRNTANLIQRLDEMKQKNIHLQEIIKKEYHLK
jgi:hypothetical protein